EKGGTIPASVAAGLALCASARPDDRVLDPFCGPGEVLRERALAGPAAALLCGDVDPKVTRSAQARLRELPARLCRWDPRRLPLKARSIDTVLSGLPSGPQAGSRQVARSLYQSLLREVLRLLRPTGRAVLLTGEGEVLASLLARQPELAVETRRPVRTGHFRAELFVIRPVLKLL
ncbi:methyltransferase domain-containing protein, partial [bacterium]|nr:methyltransferase domain-containing protein [bacterium]